MNKTPISVVVDPARPETWPAGDSDWERLKGMTDEEAEAGARADPDAPLLSPAELASMRHAPDVKALRQRLGYSQAEFAQVFRLDLRCVQDWEQGRRRPDTAARALLAIIEREPEAAQRALA